MSETLSPDTLAERDRVLMILNRYIAEPFYPQRGHSCSYDGPSFPSKEERDAHAYEDMRAKTAWCVKRLTLKSIAAQVRGENRITELDDDDDHAMMELGMVP